MTQPPEPTWKIEWRGDPSGFPRSVHVFFMNDSAPADSAQAGMELARLLEQATNDGTFNHAALTFADRHDLRVADLITGSSHRYPTAEVISLVYDREKPLTLNVNE